MNQVQDRGLAFGEGAANRSPGAFDDHEMDLSRLWGTIVVGKWKVAGFVAAAVGIAVFYLFTAAPVYRVDALLQMETEGSSALQGLMEIESELGGGAGARAQAQIEILRSRSVLRQAVEKLGLDLRVEPRYFPVVGEAWARRSGMGTPIATPVSGDDGGYAWAPVDVEVTRADLPEGLVGRTLTMRALGGGRFALLASDGERLVEGRAGEVALGTTAFGPLELFVSRLVVSEAPVDMLLQRRPWLSVVEGLQARLSVTEKGRDSGILQISLEGEDRASITDIVGTVADTYLRQNVEARSEEAEKSLEFLNEQLPELRAQLQAAEERYSQFRQNRQVADLDAEAQALLNQVVAIENQRSQLELKLAELRLTYAGQHPALEAVREQQRSLASDRAALEERIARLPEAQTAVLRLRRDVEVTTSLYTALLNRAQELRVVKAGTTGNVRIIDRPVEPVRPVGPNSRGVLALALFLGTLAGVGYVLLEAMLRRGVLDPREIEALGLPVYAVIPYSPWLARRSRRLERQSARGEPRPILVRDHPNEPAVEGLRSLRTNLYFAMGGGDTGVVLIGGPAPGIGKSFVALNLAYLVAQVDRRVVVIDADLRKGRLHEYVNADRSPGLSELLTGQVDLDVALHTLDEGGPTLITSGALPPNPSELLMRETLPGLIARLRERFDLVIIDAPPVLPVTDATIIAASVPDLRSFLVVRAGEHSISEIEEAARRMGTEKSAVSGVIFNGLRSEHVQYGGGAQSYYRYEYASDGR